MSGRTLLLVTTLSSILVGCDSAPPPEPINDQVERLCGDEITKQMFLAGGTLVIQDLVVTTTDKGLAAKGNAAGANFAQAYFSSAFDCSLIRGADQQLVVKSLEFHRMLTDSSRSSSPSGELKYIEDVQNGKTPTPPHQ